MRLRDRLVKMTEYSLYSPKSAFGITSYINLSVEEENARVVEALGALLTSVRAAVLIHMVKQKGCFESDDERSLLLTSFVPSAPRVEVILALQL